MSSLIAHIFLGCFIFGLVWTIVILMFGFDHHFFGHFHIGGHDFGGGHDMGGHHIGGHDAGAHGQADGAGARMPFLNFNGIVMFLTFFGAVGYALNRHSSATLLLTFLVSLIICVQEFLQVVDIDEQPDRDCNEDEGGSLK